ncbi:hypothetical protein IAQ61_006952 [Plenodomus lingam]|uniref:Predicted protein n=1 Tax=Leptosphaeria maculans (strain JN3 / isolate v23.1.3 / race Av1-4-5-6-7-8) TaxID=985895 RepID=E5AD14_LEPMJ|nr:predicted protein [Plenodomus lingam JN3]KAH9869739.1 hypothetical protein IAQ61_006952 [Plenodomus lingam]CBY02366.1 predicted protein [Plenodomus lingam JN3]
MLQPEKQNRFTKWLKKTFKSTPDPEYSHISRRDTLGEAFWSDNAAKYHPSSYFKLNNGRDIPHHSPVSRSNTGPHQSSGTSHAYSEAIIKRSPRLTNSVHQHNDPVPPNHSTASASPTHFRQTSTPPKTMITSRPCSAPAKPPRMNSRKPPNMTYYDYLTSINHRYPGSGSSHSHAYNTTQAYPITSRPRGPRPLLPNMTSAVPQLSYCEPAKSRYPRVSREPSHAYDAQHAGPRSASHSSRVRTREAICKDTLAQLCGRRGSYASTASSSTANNVHADWERDWDVPLSQRVGANKVICRTRGKGIQIRDRESKVAVMGREEREREGKMFRGDWSREWRRGKMRARGGLEDVVEEGEFEKFIGEEGGEVDDGKGLERVERMMDRRRGEVVQ